MAVGGIAQPPSIWRVRVTIGFLITVFLLGGSARADVLSLVILRPVAAILFVVMLFWAGRAAIHEARISAMLFSAVFVLIAMHLVPLPPAIWTMFPGRDSVIAAFAATHTKLVWLPISLSPIDGWNQFFALTVPAAAALAMLSCGRKNARSVLVGLIVILLVSAALAFLQSIGPARSPLYFYRITNNGSAVGLFANRNHQAAALACLFPMLAVWASTVAGSKTRRQAQLVMAAAAGLTVIPLLFVTGSRGGLVLGAVGLGLAWLIYRRPDTGPLVRHDIRSRRLLIGGSIAGALALITVAAFSARSVAISRLIDGDNAGELRVAALPYLVDAIWTYFPVGSGAGSFVPIYKMIEPNTLLSPSYFNHAHNDVVEVALEYGLPGMILMLVAAATWANGAFRLWRYRARHTHLTAIHMIGSAGAGVLFLLGVGSFVDYPLRVPSIAALAAVAAIWMGWAIADISGNSAGGGRTARKPLGVQLQPES